LSNIYTGVLAKLQAALPGQIGTNARYATSTVKDLIIAADRATRDLCEVHFAVQEISLTDDTIGYDVAQNFISIEKVEFSLDGTNYDWILKPKSMTDLDGCSHSWRTDRSTRPDAYTLLSAPGVQDNGDAVVPSQILLYPTLETAGSAKIKITGVMTPAVGSFDASHVPEDVQIKCHVPFVKSVLLAVADTGKSASEYQNFIMGCESVRNRFRQQYKDIPGRM
jgi:hypothetical protein